MGFVCSMALLFLVLLPYGVFATHEVNRWPARQFTIRGMLLFIFLWAVCLSQISLIGLERPETVVWRQDWIVLFVWIVLAIFYWRVRQFTPLFLHGMCIVFVVCFIPFDRAMGKNWGNIEWYLWNATWIGSFASLIFFSIKMFLAMFRRPPHEEDRLP
jgi:predicted membrane protein